MFSTPMKSAGENVKDELITQNTLIGEIIVDEVPTEYKEEVDTLISH